MGSVWNALSKALSIDLAIYAAIAIILLLACVRCLLPVASMARKLRKDARIIIQENRQKTNRKPAWRNIGFLGSKMESIWTDFLQNVELREAHGETCDVGDFINEDDVLYTVGSLSLADLTPGLLTSLGILGTFLGLVRGLSGLRLDAADTQALLQAMQQLIGGMSTAFLTSIAGVSASLVFSLLNNRQMTKCRRAIDRFCEVFTLYAMPKPVSPVTETLSLQQEQTAYLRKASGELAAKVSEQIEAGIARGMLPMQRSMDNFIVAATQAQVEGVDQIVQLFLKRMTSSLTGEIETLRSVLRSVSEQQQRCQQEMSAANAAIAEMARDVIQMQQMSQGLLEHFQAYVTDMAGSKTSVEQQLLKTNTLLDTLAGHADALQQTQNRIASLQKQLETAAGEVTGMQENCIREIRQETESTVRGLRDAAPGIKRAADALSSAGERLSRPEVARLAESITNMTSALASLESRITSLASMLEQHDQKKDETGAR